MTRHTHNTLQADTHTALQGTELTDVQLPDDHGKFLREMASESDRVSARERVREVTHALIRTSGKGLVLVGVDLRNLDISGFDLARANLTQAQLYGTKLIGTDLSHATIICPGVERTDFSRAKLCGAYVHSLAATVCNFTDADLTGLVDATGALFHGSNLRGANISFSMLAGAAFYQCDLTNADLSGANLQGASFNECMLDAVRMKRSMVKQLVITKCHLAGLSMSEAVGDDAVIQSPTCCDRLDLSGADLYGLRCCALSGTDILAERLRAAQGYFRDCSFKNATFAHSDLSASSWTHSTLEECTFERANLDDVSWLHVTAEKVNLADANAENVRIIRSNLVNAHMARFRSRCAYLRDCDLSDADLTEAYLYRSMITGDPPRAMSMRRVLLAGANLVQAYLTADMDGANLEGAVLTYARLNQSIFANANLSGVSAVQASAVKTDFSNAQLNGFTSMLFADRCPGLAEQLRMLCEDPGSARLATFLGKLQQIIAEMKG